MHKQAPILRRCPKLNAEAQASGEGIWYILCQYMQEIFFGVFFQIHFSHVLIDHCVHPTFYRSAAQVARVYRRWLSNPLSSSRTSSMRAQIWVRAFPNFLGGFFQWNRKGISLKEKFSLDLETPYKRCLHILNSEPINTENHNGAHLLEQNNDITTCFFALLLAHIMMIVSLSY